eukprot:4396796-Pleurochrysis_carterae.AAC.1
MQGDISQQALDSSAVLGFMRNQLHFYRRRSPLSLSLPHAVVTPGESAYTCNSGLQQQVRRWAAARHSRSSRLTTLA